MVGRIEVEPEHSPRSVVIPGTGPRWVLMKRIRFEASHILKNHDGKCARLHGHSWIADVSVIGVRLMQDGPQRGMVLDYGRLKEALKPIEDALDHRHLNDLDGIDYPTSEMLASWIAWKAAPALRALGLPPDVSLYSVTVHETCTSACTFYP